MGVLDPKFSPVYFDCPICSGKLRYIALSSRYLCSEASPRDAHYMLMLSDDGEIIEHVLANNIVFMTIEMMSPLNVLQDMGSKHTMPLERRQYSIGEKIDIMTRYCKNRALA